MRLKDTLTAPQSSTKTLVLGQQLTIRFSVAQSAYDFLD